MHQELRKQLLNNLMGIFPIAEKHEGKLDSDRERMALLLEVVRSTEATASTCKHLDSGIWEVASGCLPGSRGGPVGTPVLLWTFSYVSETALSPSCF